MLFDVSARDDYGVGAIFVAFFVGLSYTSLKRGK